MLNSGTTTGFLSVSFSDVNNGIVVGGYGILLQTTDGGNTWVSENSGVAGDIFGVSMVNSNAATIVGANGSILSSMDVTLPVELVSFGADINNGQVILKWTTSTETNNRGFEIQRKSTKSNFAKIGFIEGRGTTTKANNYSYIDLNRLDGDYFYRLKQIDYDGSYKFSKTIEVHLNVPSKFSLSQNYPNPFNPSTKINFELAANSKVTLKVFNILGQEVATLISKELTAGSHSINFNASALTSGIYFYSMTAKGEEGSKYTSTKKMILMK